MEQGLQSFDLVSEISASCTRKVFPETGVQIIVQYCHMHGLGQRCLVELIRDGEIVANLLDEYHDHWKENPVLGSHFILPGDTIRIHCIYNTTQLHYTIEGGIGFPDEMCDYYFSTTPPVDRFDHHFRGNMVKNEPGMDLGMIECGTRG